MRDDPPDRLFRGYDGTVFVRGAVGARSSHKGNDQRSEKAARGDGLVPALP